MCRPFTTSVSFGVPPVRLNLLPCKMILHTILRPCGMKSFRKSDFQGRQMSCTGRTAIADNAENRFIWKISCVLKVFALGNHHYTENRGNRSLSEIHSEFPLFLLALMSSHYHHFKWWFELALIRAGYMLAQKGGYRKHCYWSAIKRYFLNLLFLTLLPALLYISLLPLL